MKKILLIFMLFFTIFTFSSCNDFDENNKKDLYAQIVFTNGQRINIKLYYDLAPMTVDNFIKLVKDEYYNGLEIHRVNEYLFQTGHYYRKNDNIYERENSDPIKGEFRANGWDKNITLKHELGTISMARTAQYDSATSQFFMCSCDCHEFDGLYAAFGKTTDERSNDVIKKICSLETKSYSGILDEYPIKSYKIKKIRLSNKQF